jgi:hypothetical protein
MTNARNALICFLLVSVSGLIACGVDAQKLDDSSKPDARSPSDFRDLDTLFALIEQDLPKEATHGRRGRESPRFAGLATGYKVEAEDGERLAQFKLGAMYLEGLGVPLNPAQAVHWFSQAGGRDHPLAQLALGKSLQGPAAAEGAKRQRQNVMEALGKIGPAAEQAIPNIRLEIEHGGPAARAAAIALGRIGERGVTVLIQALQSKDVGIRRVAAEGLSEAGTAARTSIPQLNVALTDEDPITRDYANRALSRLRQSGVIK